MWLDRRAYPFPSHYLSTDAGRMHYVDEGAGPPVVMVHGNPTWSFLYRHLIRHLSPSYRCVAPDHLGFGLSDKPENWTYHPADHAANLAALIETLHLDDILLVVQDWGGPIGLRYAVEHPDRIRGIVIMNSWMWSVRGDLYYRGFSGIVGGPLGRYLTRRYNFFAQVIMKAVYAHPSKLTEEIHRHYTAPLATPSDRRGSAEFPRQIVAASDWLDDLWERRHALDDVPKTIVWGMKDIGFRRKELGRWRSAYPSAAVVELDDTGHYVQEEAPDRLAAAVDDLLAATAA